MNKKEIFIKNGGKEQDYEAHVQAVCRKREFNKRNSNILNYYGFNLSHFLNEAKENKIKELAIQKNMDISQLTEQEWKMFILNESNCPISVVEEYLKCADSFEINTKEGFLAEYFSGMPEWCWLRWGDRNHLDKDIKRNYINDDALALDTAVIEFSELAGFEITEQDVIEFCLMYPKGNKTYLTQKQQLANKFKELTGLSLNDDYAKQFTEMLRGNVIIKIETVADDDIPF